jgi:very-short-patch-repair endonuclease
MDPHAVAAALAREGVVLLKDLGQSPRRTAWSSGLRELHAGVFLARTQPATVAVHLAAVEAAWSGREVFVLGPAAVWLHGYGEAPERLSLGVPQTRELVTSPDVAVRRLAPSVLDGWRWRHGCRVVSLEVAVIQTAVDASPEEVLHLCEELVRSRRTTLARLRSRCRRGLNGSAAVRRACDQLSGGSMDADVRRLQRALAARGVTGLEVEVRFENGKGGSAYADLLHRPTMTVLEVDGRISHTSREEFRRDRRRDRWMRREHGVTTLRVDVSEIREDLDAVADEIAALLDQIAAERSAA